MRNNIQPMKNLLDAQSKTLKQNTYEKDQIKTLLHVLRLCEVQFMLQLR